MSHRFAFLFSLILGVFVSLIGLTTRPATGAEPGWSPVIVARGSYRHQIESLPIEQRPYRPLHFYGNSVRRSHYRGNPLPLPKDVIITAGQIVRRAP